MSPMTNGQRTEAAKIDAAVLAALGQDGVSFRVLMKRLKMAHSATTIRRSLGRLIEDGKVEKFTRIIPKKVGRPKMSIHKGHGPEPTVFWRRI